jgi:hypothetical protein
LITQLDDYLGELVSQKDEFDLIKQTLIDERNAGKKKEQY